MKFSQVNVHFALRDGFSVSYDLNGVCVRGGVAREQSDRGFVLVVHGLGGAGQRAGGLPVDVVPLRVGGPGLAVGLARVVPGEAGHAPTEDGARVGVRLRQRLPDRQLPREHQEDEEAAQHVDAVEGAQENLKTTYVLQLQCKYTVLLYSVI